MKRQKSVSLRMYLLLYAQLGNDIIVLVLLSSGRMDLFTVVVSSETIAPPTEKCQSSEGFVNCERDFPKPRRRKD